MNPMLAHLLDAANRAPSAHNTQPWLLSWHDDALEIRLKPDRLLPAVDASNADALHGLGALLENVLLTLEQLGQSGSYTVADQLDVSKPIIHLTWNESQHSPGDPTLYRMIPIRHTSRIPYRAQAVDPKVLSSLAEAILPPCTLRFIIDPDQINRVRQLVADATLEQFDDATITKELYEWLRFSRRDRRWFRDGLNSDCMGLKPWQAKVARQLLKPGIIRALGWCRLKCTAYGGIDMNAPQAPVLCLLTLESNSVAARIEGGRSLQRIWLTAASHGLATHPISAAVDVSSTRSKVYDFFNVPPGHVHVNLFRLGYSDPVARSHRLPVDEILTAGLPISS